MKLPIQYGENIIVAVIYNGTWSWYVTDKEYWYLDLTKLEQAYLDKGYQWPNVGDYSERFDIALLNEDSAADFLHKINEFKVSVVELSELLLKLDDTQLAQPDSLTEFTPALLVDFDEKVLISYFPEPASFEYYIPNDWIGRYESFMDQVPPQEKYWIIQGKDYFSNR
ncbi:hypothetical protein [Paenibacillus wenxiniae]|uniref:Group-specific protein n=1 Tax=Paenibacillus wenxiniae TaxID=1636843 RepID=A0ABW4RMR1_9BACL